MAELLEGKCMAEPARATPQDRAHLHPGRPTFLFFIQTFSIHHFGGGSLFNVKHFYSFDCHFCRIIVSYFTGPVLDATEFPARFALHCKGTQTLGNEGGLIAMLLVTWAEAFGLNEHGLPHPSPDQSGRSTDSSDYIPALSANMRIKWKNKTELYLREILELVDCHSLLRRPSLDGLRVLLLLLPLMEGELKLSSAICDAKRYARGPRS